MDLATRSFGDLLGDDQSGLATGLGLVDLTTDGEIIERTRHDATALLDGNEKLVAELISDIDEEQSNYLDRS